MDEEQNRRQAVMEAIAVLREVRVWVGSADLRMSIDRSVGWLLESFDLDED